MTWAGVSAGYWDRSAATAPLTTAAAMLVPLIRLYRVPSLDLAAVGAEDRDSRSQQVGLELVGRAQVAVVGRADPDC